MKVNATNQNQNNSNEEESPLLTPDCIGYAHVQYSTFVNSNQNEDIENDVENNHLSNDSVNNNLSNDHEEKNQRFGLHKSSKRNYFTLFILSYGMFWISCCYALIAPFFPQEAKKKGMSATVYGFVFGVFQLTMCITGPIFGKIMPKVTPRFFAVYGLFLSGGCSVLFGIISYAPDGKPFIILAFAIRIVEALGTTGFYVSALTIGVETFPDNRGFVTSVIEGLSGIGMIIGPAAGGFLYQAGGYFLPFVTLGGTLMLGFVFSALILPKSRSTELTDNQSLGIWRLLKHPGFYVHLSLFIFGFMLVGFNEATLGHHLEQFHLKEFQTGLVFTVPAILYALGTPFWGHIADKINKKAILCLIGISFCSIGFLLIGPVGFLKLKSTLWMIIVALVLQGIGFGGILLPAFLLCISDTIKIGYPDETSTYGMISGIYSSSSALGAFIGPSVGGIMIDTIGYINGTLIIFCLSLFIMAEMILYTLITLQCKHRNEEREPILQH